MTLSHLLAGILPNLVASAASGSPADTLHATPADTSISVVDSTAPTDSAMHPAPRRTAPPPPLWGFEGAVGLQFSAIDFQERKRFASDLASEASANKRAVDQPFPGSDIGTSVSVEVALRRRDALRLALGCSWRTWSAQAVSRDTTVAGNGTLHDRSYGSDLFLANIGADVMISRSILRLDAARDAYLGARWLVGAGRLSGRSDAWGPAMGASLRTGAEFLDWKSWAVSAHLGLEWISVQSSSPWKDVLWYSSLSEKAAWGGGGLSLGMELRWGSPRDSIPGKSKTAQKK